MLASLSRRPFVNVVIRMEKKRERIIHLTRKDFEFTYFRVSGAGGQHRDKTSNGCRCKHSPSGAIGECSENRSRTQNQKVAFRRMAESKKFQDWIKLEHAKRIGAIEDAVNEAMRPENLLIEYAESFPESS